MQATLDNMNDNSWVDQLTALFICYTPLGAPIGFVVGITFGGQSRCVWLSTRLLLWQPESTCNLFSAPSPDGINTNGQSQLTCSTSNEWSGPFQSPMTGLFIFLSLMLWVRWDTLVVAMSKSVLVIFLRKYHVSRPSIKLSKRNIKKPMLSLDSWAMSTRGFLLPVRFTVHLLAY